MLYNNSNWYVDINWPTLLCGRIKNLKSGFTRDYHWQITKYCNLYDVLANWPNVDDRSHHINCYMVRTSARGENTSSLVPQNRKSKFLMFPVFQNSLCSPIALKFISLLHAIVLFFPKLPESCYPVVLMSTPNVRNVNGRITIEWSGVFASCYMPKDQTTQSIYHL